MVGKHRSAFTLVELLITFSILLILSAVLLPAVQSSREAARLASCRNNISQLSKAMVEFETFNGYFPSGGWSQQWLSVAERPGDSAQPGGWTYGVLPFINEMSVRNTVANVSPSSTQAAYDKLVSASLPGFSCPSRRGSKSLALTSTSFQGGAVTLSKATRSDFAMNGGTVGSCPDLALYAAAAAAASKTSQSKTVSVCQTSGSSLTVALSGLGGQVSRDDDDDNDRDDGDDNDREDGKDDDRDDDRSKGWSLSSLISYVCGSGSKSSGRRDDDDNEREGDDNERDDDDNERDDDDGEREYGSTVTRLGSCDSCGQPVDAIISHPVSLTEGDSWRKMTLTDRLTKLSDKGIPDVQNGMSGRMGRLQAASVRDGLSNTYLIGEKCVASDTYYKGTDQGDSGAMMGGYSSDTVRWGMTPPARDAKGVSNPRAFGSAHQGGCNVSYADGMVRTVSFDIDPTVHAQLSCRDDGKGMPPK